ncbi:MAG TPA: type II secretion system F family protein [bacterium]|nr:type II secretion system F family protein [bacterium]
MPLYSYKAVTADGRLLQGEAVAQGIGELRGQLEDQGLLVKGVKTKRVVLLSAGGQKVKAEELLQANQELITLLQAGLTLPEALELVADRPQSPVLASIFKSILSEVRGGSRLSEACAKHPKIFDGLYLSSLKTGEKSGNLAAPLSRYQEYLAGKILLEGKVAQALVYPAFLLFVLVGVLALLFTFVLPRFAALYAGFNQALPLPTRVLMALVARLPWILTLAAGAGTALWLGFRTAVSTAKGRLWLGEFQLRLPFLRDYTRPFLLSQLARTLSTLLGGGTTLSEALHIAGETQANSAFAGRLRAVTRQVLEGGSLSGALAGEELIPRQAIKLIQVGEASGRLETMLQEVARSLERQLEGRVQRALALVEPVFILAAGLVIGTVIVVMYLPILHLSDVVR